MKEAFASLCPDMRGRAARVAVAVFGNRPVQSRVATAVFSLCSVKLRRPARVAVATLPTLPPIQCRRPARVILALAAHRPRSP